MHQNEGLNFPAPTAGPVAITNVNVAPMDTARVLDAQTVIIEDGVITALGPQASVSTEGAYIIDGSGKYLMPGLADMHVHYWDIGEFGMFLANGVTLVRNMWGSPFHLALQRKVNEGAFPGPRVVTTSPIIDGPGPNGTTIWPGSAMAARPEDAGPMIRQFAARGYQQTKAYSWLKLDVLQALGRASREVGIRMVGHCPDGITYEEAIDAGMTCFEHLTGIVTGRLGGRTLAGMRMGSAESMQTVIDHTDFDSIRRLAQRLAREDIWNCTTLVVWQGMAQDVQVAMANPLLVYEPETMVASWNPANDFRLKATMDSRAEWLKLARARIEVYRRIITTLHEEGAPLLLGTDTPNPFVFQGFTIHDELANLVSAGLSPYQALRTGTVEAARFLDEEGAWGTIGVGKRADLLLLNANPLDDVTAVKRPEAVFVNGYVFLREDLDALLAQRAATVNEAEAVGDLDLPAAPTGSETTHEGMLAEKLAGRDAGRIRYRHTRRPDGSWLIEEAGRIGADGLRSWGGTSSAEVELSSELTIVRASTRSGSFLGTEAIDVELSDDTNYAIRFTEIDGHETTINLDGPLPAGEELAFTALPLLLANRSPDEGSVAVLGSDNTTPTAIPVELTRQPDEDEGARVWQAHLRRGGTTADQTYRLSPDGAFLSLEEQTWRGLRQVEPLE